MEKYTYLLINILTISVPLSKSFERKISFWSGWPGLLQGIAITAAVFIPWDIAFTRMGVWGFNQTYLSGISLAGLPIEEWLFFFTIPYACLFIYEAIKYYQPRDWLGPISYPVSYVIIAACVLLGVINFDKWYTAVTCLFTAIFMAFVVFVIRPKYLGRFYMGYVISLIPFLLVNGILTGSFISEEVVWYNDAENLSVRIFTIPVEDAIYMLLLLLINTVIYESWKARSGKSPDA